MWLLRLGGQTPKGNKPCGHGVTHSLGIMQAEGQDEREEICQELM